MSRKASWGLSWRRADECGCKRVPKFGYQEIPTYRVPSLWNMSGRESGLWAFTDYKQGNSIPKASWKKRGHFGLIEFFLKASKGILVLVDPVLHSTARLRILYYFVQVNQSFTPEIKRYIKRSFHLLALSSTFKQLQMEKVRGLGKYFLQPATGLGQTTGKGALLKAFLADGPFTINQSLRSKNKR